MKSDINVSNNDVEIEKAGKETDSNIGEKENKETNIVEKEKEDQDDMVIRKESSLPPPLMKGSKYQPDYFSQTLFEDK